MKLIVRITERNPFAWLAHIVMAIVTYAYFTTTSLPLITYMMLGSVAIYVLSDESWQRLGGNGYIVYSAMQIAYVYTVSALGTVQTSMARSIIYQMLVCLCYFVYARSQKKIVDLVLFYVAVAVSILCARILVDDSLASMLQNVDRVGQYYTYENNNRNTIGIILGMGVMYMMHLGCTKRKIWFLPMIIAVVLSLLTGSRKAILIIAAGGVLYTYLYAKYCMRKKAKGVLVFFFVILLVITLIYACYNHPALYNILGHRIDGFIAMLTGDGGQEASAVERASMISKAFEMFMEKPLLGWGIEGFARYSGFGVYSHNNYMETLVSFGIFGFFLMYGGKIMLLMLQAQAMKRSLSIQRSALCVVIFVLMVTALIIDFAAVTMNGVVSNLPFALSAAILFTNMDMENERL